MIYGAIDRICLFFNLGHSNMSDGMIIYEGLEISGESVLCDIRGRVMVITVML